ncbi:MAG: DUF1800 family protein [Candidatus Kapaibacterium sp.]
MNRRELLTFPTRIILKSNLVQFNKSQNHSSETRTLSVGMESYTGEWTYKQAAHLLRRCMYGVKDSEIRKAVSDGLDKTVKTLFASWTPPLDELSTWINQEPQVKPEGSPPTQQQLQDFNILYTAHKIQYQRWLLKTMVNQPVTLQEKMVQFWSNHFVTDSDTVRYAEFMNYLSQMFRTKGYGNFKQMVRDVTTDVSMLIYLDGVKNVYNAKKPGINENYAREVQELFTMGVYDWNGKENYTQKDISEMARAISGWNLTLSPKGGTDFRTNLYRTLTSTFFPATWDPGDKTIYGKTGKWKVDDVVDLMFSERGDSISKFICEKIYKAFVYNVPDRGAIGDMAKTFVDANWDVKTVLNLLLRSAHFYDESNLGAIDKSPFDYMIGLVRSLSLNGIPDFTLSDTSRLSSNLNTRLTTIGQEIANPPNVKGWEGGRLWISVSTLPTRHKFLLDVMDGKITSKINNKQTQIYTFDPISFAKGFPDYDDTHKLADNMNQFFLSTKPSSKEATLLFNTLLDGGVDYEWKIDDPAQKAGERIKKYIKAVAVLAKMQLT